MAAKKTANEFYRDVVQKDEHLKLKFEKIIDSNMNIIRGPEEYVWQQHLIAEVLHHLETGKWNYLFAKSREYDLPKEIVELFETELSNRQFREMRKKGLFGPLQRSAALEIKPQIHYRSPKMTI